MPLDFKHLEKTFYPFVRKPDRYTGGELNLPRLPDSPVLRIGLAFPDLYELGMSYLGLRILLHRAQQVEGVACERVFMPWFDAVEKLRDTGLPLFTLETRTPLHQLDLLGINLQYELHATNILALLELGGIPLRSNQRSESDPLVLGGGPLSLHPEPFAPFFDAIVVGDGEEVLPEILECLKGLKARGLSRQEKVRALGEIPGVYLPGGYKPQYTAEGRYLGLERLDSTLPETIQMRITPQLKPEYYPPRPLVPTVEATHNRLVVEIARGCSHGCRFCGPGMVNRPVRERPITDIVHEIETGLDATGYQEVSLLSLSAADYGCLDQLLAALDPILKDRQVSLSFPSLRPDKFTPEIADRAAAGSRTGLTLAPEAATSRLRAVINKEVSDDDLLRAVQLAYERQWKSVKLYFMIGLPSETDEDAWAIVDLVRKVMEVGRQFGGRGLNVSVSPFTPKPHTPFERYGQVSFEDLSHRLGILKRGLSRYHSVRLEIRNLNVSRIEAAIARGDRRTADAIEACYRAGGLFDAWTDGFSSSRWEEGFHKAGLDLSQISRSIPEGQALPWSHIQAGISAEFLDHERQAALDGQYTDDCRSDQCHLCGLQRRPDLPCPEIPRLDSILPPLKKGGHGGDQKKEPGEPHLIEEGGRDFSAFYRYRLVYSRTSPSQFVSHLDVLGVLERALRRLGMPLEFTVGMRPHLRLKASPPLAVGMTSQGEYLDFGLGEPWDPKMWVILQEALPPGFAALNLLPQPEKSPSLGALDTFLYRATFTQEPGAMSQDTGKLPSFKGSGGNFSAAIQQLLDANNLPIRHISPGKVITFDGRPAIWKLELADDGSLLIGLKSSGGPMPKVADILSQLTDGSDEEITSAWSVERIGQWWDIEGQRYSPIENNIRGCADPVQFPLNIKGGRGDQNLQPQPSLGGETKITT
jgi:radical SAM family uncharacterized protein/radical SAM-linked protein